MKNIILVMLMVALPLSCFAQQKEDLFSKDYTGKYVDILLKNGREFKCKIISQRGENFYFNMYGGEVAFGKSEVKKITELDANGTKETIARDNQAVIDGLKSPKAGIDFFNNPNPIQENKPAVTYNAPRAVEKPIQNAVQEPIVRQQKTQTQQRASSPRAVSNAPNNAPRTAPRVSQQVLQQKSTSQKIVDNAVKNTKGGYSHPK